MVTFKCGACGMTFNIRDASMETWKLGSEYATLSACPNCLTTVPFSLFRSAANLVKENASSEWTGFVTPDPVEGK